MGVRIHAHTHTHTHTHNHTHAAAASAAKGRSTWGLDYVIGIWVFTRRLLDLIRPFYGPENLRRPKALWLSLGMVVLLLFESGLLVAFSYIQKDFATALTNHDREGFYNGIIRYFVAIMVSTPVFSTSKYFQDRLSIECRSWLTFKLCTSYFSSGAFYHLKVEDDASRGIQSKKQTIDNPDQRIADDVKNFSNSVVTVAVLLFGKLVRVMSFMSVLYSISPMLGVFIFVYCILGSYITGQLFGTSLKQLHYEGQKAEANFRFSLVRVREYAEEIAFYGGGPRESHITSGLFSAVRHNTIQVFKLNWGLMMIQNVFSWTTIVLPYLAIAERYLGGEMEFGVVNQTAMAFRVIQGGLGVMVQELRQLASLSAETERLVYLMRKIDMHANSTTSEVAINKALGQITLIKDCRPTHVLQVKGLWLRTPNDHHVVCEDLSFTLSRNQSLLIYGPSGCGKSSLLRAMCGLWRSGQGEVVRPNDAACLFMPQKPYLCMCASLAEQLTYPNTSVFSNRTCSVKEGDRSGGTEARTTVPVGSLDQSKIRELLESVNLSHLLDDRRFDSDSETNPNASPNQWSSLLSVGEQQRLALCRLLLRRPTLAFLDEATAALDSENERMFYGHIRSHTESYVSIGHRDSLIPLHTHVLAHEVPDGDDGNSRTQSWKVYTSSEFLDRHMYGRRRNGKGFHMVPSDNDLTTHDSESEGTPETHSYMAAPRAQNHS